jgi:hypothetical protein
MFVRANSRATPPSLDIYPSGACKCVQLLGWLYIHWLTYEAQVSKKMTTTVQTTKEVEVAKPKISYMLQSKWSNRFIWAAIIQGLAAVLITVPIVLPWQSPSVSRVIAAGGAGTWFTVGYVLYITVGVMGVALTALFYHHFEVVQGKPYTGVRNYMAWVHLILMNVGVAAVTFILMYGGYVAGGNMLPASSGGLGWTATQAHELLLGPLVNPAGYALIATGIGVLSGGLGFVVTYFRK